jgi:cell division protein FtsZ
MIFGAVIDESLKDEIKVTVIATGFDHRPSAAAPTRRPLGQHQDQNEARPSTSTLRPFGSQPSNDQLDIPTFLRNRRNTDK